MSKGDKVTVTDGSYKILSAQDTSIALDVRDGSAALRSNVWLYSDNESPAQIFRIATESAGGQRIWAGTGADRCIDIQGYYSTGAAITDGTNVMIYSPDSYPDQRFYFEDSGQGTATINGVAYQRVAIVPVSNSKYCFDAQGGKAYIRDNVQVWTKHYGINQCFVLVPDTVLRTELQVPTSVGGRLSESTAPSTALQLATTETNPTVYPTWKFPYRDAAIRTRWRGRKNGSWTAWSDYTALVDGAKTSYGWGAKGFRSKSLSDGWNCYAGKGVKVDLSTYDKVEVQVCVRPTDVAGFSSSTAAGTTGTATAHGRDASATVAVCRKPSVTVKSLGWSPAGLSLTMQTTDATGPVSGRVKVAGVTGWVSFSGEPAGAFTIDVPQASLLSVPADGKGYGVSGSLTTADKVAASWPTATVQCGYSTGWGETVTPSISFSDDGHATCDLSSHASRDVWVECDGEYHLMREDASGVTWLALPSERPYSIWALAQDGERWGTWHKAYAATHHDGYRLVWEGGSDVVWLGDGANPKISWSESANSNADLSTGRDWELVTVGEGRKGSATVSGGWMATDPVQADLRLTALLDARFAWLCTPRGAMWRVALESGSCTQQDTKWTDVDLGVRRVDG